MVTLICAPDKFYTAWQTEDPVDEVARHDDAYYLLKINAEGSVIKIYPVSGKINWFVKAKVYDTSGYPTDDPDCGITEIKESYPDRNAYYVPFPIGNVKLST